MVKEYKERQRKDFLVSVIIPVFNEEVTVGDVVTRTKKTLEKMGVRYEVLVVDDGSDDRSPELANLDPTTKSALSTIRGRRTEGISSGL